MATPRTKKDQRRVSQLLGDLGAGQSESEGPDDFKKRFHPVVEHIRAFDPTVVLVVGERGTGKSALFRAVFENKLLTALVRYAPNVRMPAETPEQVDWTQAYPHRNFPDALGLRRSLQDGGDERALKLWLAYLVRTLRTELEGEASCALAEIWRPPGGDPQAVLKAFDNAANEPLVALDQLDERLSDEDRWLFVGYDELDTLGGYDWQAMRQALSGLIGFWASYSRRWRRLRAKLFVRTDLFRRHSGFGGADLAKLAAHRVELTWSDRNLWAMLIKRIANTHEDLLDYCRIRTIRIPFTDDPDFGFIPQLENDQQAQPWVERLAGVYMGTGVKKGQTFNWILGHLRDAHGHVVPRNLVRLIEQSALKEQFNQKARLPRLLHPTALRLALEDVSGDHVRQGFDEWPWLDGLNRRLRGQLVPIERVELRELLRVSWEEPWSGDPSVRPPVASAEEFIDHLLELGVLSERYTDSRVDVPDIFLYGLGLKRKGGVRRG